MIGRTVGKYRIVGQLGRGGAGVVYKAVDETLGRDVAVKMLNPDLADTEVMTRFRAEATILARLNHPQIATIYELFRADADYLMVMEFVRGEALDKLSERLGAIEPERAAYVIDLILSALEHAHRAGVVHRDVKPANVMLTDEGGIKIMDFGIARVLGAEQKTVDGRLMGTPAYMSPEQVLGEEVDGRADLYSVGVLLYRLLSGTLPFKADSALAMLQRQIRDEPISLHLQRPELPDWCDQIVQRALMKAPADRFQSAEEFRDALAQATGPLPVADLAKTFAASAPSSPGPTDTIDLSRAEALVEPEAPVVPARRKRQGGFAMAYSLVTVLTIAVAFAAYVIVRGADRESTVETVEAPAPTLHAPEALPAKEVVDLPAPEPIVENSETASARGPQRASLRVGVEAPVTPRTERPAPPEPRAIAPTPRHVDAPPRPEPTIVEHASTTPPIVVDAALTFETRVLVGTKKPKEYSARLLFGEGRITVVANDETASRLYEIPYGRVVSISYSHGRDPMWNSPQGPTPVARGGGTLGRLGIIVERNWIALRTSTEEQFVALRFEKVLEQRVLLALEERTGRKPELVEEAKD
jgi:eukaryotic-like serine/threonine-protein kinase